MQSGKSFDSGSSLNNSKISLQVNGATFVECRRVRGWSQEELSRRSGYSVRVISKAESSGTLKVETIQCFCEAFSQAGSVVTLEQLTRSKLDSAKKVVEAYDNYGVEMLQHCREYLTSDIVYNIHADPARVPYAGQWEGLDGFQKFLDIFFSIFVRRPGILKPSYMVGDDRVHARFLDQAVCNGVETPWIYINLHFQFRGDLVCQMDNEFDSDLTASSLDNSQLRKPNSGETTS